MLLTDFCHQIHGNITGQIEGIVHGKLFLLHLVPDTGNFPPVRLAEPGVDLIGSAQIFHDRFRTQIRAPALIVAEFPQTGHIGGILILGIGKGTVYTGRNGQCIIDQTGFIRLNHIDQLQNAVILSILFPECIGNL